MFQSKTPWAMAALVVAVAAAQAQAPTPAATPAAPAPAAPAPATPASAAPAPARAPAPEGLYAEGSVWALSLVKTRAGMQDAYLQELSGARRELMAEARKQGLIVSDKILVGSASSREDFDVLLMIEYRNWAALDGLSAKLDAVAAKSMGSVDKQVQVMSRRTDLREVLGDKYMQEINFR